MDSRLYQASVKGDVNTLHNLIHDNPLILENATMGRLDRNPLHIAASVGHLEFTRVLLSLNTNLVNTNLVTKSDSRGHCPLHLASEKGHIEIVRELLLPPNDAVCLEVDNEGRIPLHLAAMRGHVNVVMELIGARLESINAMTKKENKETVLHLCVRYNRLEALKLLLELAPSDSLVCAQDNDGNTVLHLATALQNKEIIKYLLSLPDVKGLLAKMMNKKNLTALDVSEHGKSIEIPDILHEAGVPGSELPNQALKSLRFARKHLTMNDDWLKDYRGHLITTSTVIATVAFQAGVTPPGGVWQDDGNGSFNNTTQGSHEAGTSILATKYFAGHAFFAICNTLCFFTSVIAILLLISGFAFKNKFLMGILNQAVFYSITFMVFSYAFSVETMIPRTDRARTLLAFICQGATFMSGAVLIAVTTCHVIEIQNIFERKISSKPDGSSASHQSET